MAALRRRCRPRPPSGALPANVKLGRYHAIVIGNNSYSPASGYANLQSAVNDATAVAQLLRSKYNYQTKLLLNATRFDILGRDERDAGEPHRRGQPAGLLRRPRRDRADGKQGFWIPVDAQAA